MARMHTPREEVPRFIEPMLADSGLPTRLSDDWALELKWDGLRAQLRVDGRRAWTLRSRPGRDCSAEFPELAELAETLRAHRVILDGELVHLSANGNPDFSAISRRLVGRGRQSGPVDRVATFVAFDVLHLDGHPVRALPYADRRQVLAELLADGPLWRAPRPLSGPVDAVLAVTRDAHLEGIVAKRLSAPYEPGRRSGAWRKHKHRRAEWLTVTAWTPAGDRPRQRPALHVARRADDGQLIGTGAVQLGLSSNAAEPLRRVLDKAAGSSARVRRIPLRPGITVEVDYHGPPGGALRDAVLRRVRLNEPGAV